MLTFIKKQHVFFFILFILAWCVCVRAQTVNFPLESSSILSLEEIQQSIPDPILVETLTFDANAYVDAQEFSYLIGFKEGDLITAAQLKQAVDHLQLKRRFESIDISIAPGVLGKHVHIALRSFWALDRLRIHGWLRGKEKYRALYLIGFGEKFDESKHMHSIKKMQDTLRADGFFNACVTSEFTYDYHMRTMSVDLTVKKGKVFSIGKVNLKVANFELQNKLYKTFLKPLKRHTYSKAQVQEVMHAIKEYLSNVGYLSVELRIDEEVHAANFLIDLNISIEYAGKRTIVFFGNHFFSSHELLEMLLAFGRSAWLVPAQILSEELLNAYRKKGFWNATIEPHDEPDRYLFVIHEGERASVRDVVFKISRKDLNEQNGPSQPSPRLWRAGNLPRDEQDVEANFDLKAEQKKMVNSVSNKTAHSLSLNEKKNTINSVHHELPALRSLGEVGRDVPFIKKFFYPLLASEYYEEKLLSQALADLRTHYQNLGYLDATIIDQTFQEREEAGAFNLVLTIDEGVRWVFKSAKIPEYPDLESNDLFQVREVPFNAELLESQRTWLINYFTTQGYSAVRVTPIIHKDDDHSVSVDWQVAKGPQARFGKTIIVGTSSLPFELIRKELQYNEGDAWNPETVKKTFACLKELEIFDSIQLHPAAESANEIEKTMVLKLHHDDPYEIRARAGIELQYIQEYRTFGGLTYKLGGSFIAKNPFNRGGIFSVDTDFARSHFEVVTKYRQPSFFSVPVRTTLQAYAIKHDQPGFVGNTNNLYRLTQYGGLVNFGKKTEHVDAGLNIGFEWMETKLNEQTRLFAIALARALNFDIRLLDKNVPYFLVEPTLLVDFVDNNLYPRRGSLTLISAKGMFPLKHSEIEAYFVKLLFEQSFYFPIDPVVIALRLRFGHIFFQDFSAIMPSERFYLGGSQSIRSYNADLAPPLGVFCDDKGKEMIVPRGGKTMVNGNAEVRIPLHVSLEGVVFQDLGMLSSDNFATFKAHDILAGTGFGIRLKTPIGPLRFDFGFKWKRDVPSQPGWAWTLMFGNAY